MFCEICIAALCNKEVLPGWVGGVMDTVYHNQYQTSCQWISHSSHLTSKTYNKSTILLIVVLKEKGENLSCPTVNILWTRKSGFVIQT